MNAVIENARAINAQQASQRVMELDGQCHLLVVTVDGKIQDPWAFTEYIDAQAKKLELDVIAEEEGIASEAEIFRLTIQGPGIEPPRGVPATEVAV